MNPIIKKLWVDALRSGEYKQGTDQLRHPVQSGGYAYCCLGVLCDLYREYHSEARRDRTEFIADEEAESFLLPQAVMDWAEVSLACPIVVRGGVAEGLADINDGGAEFQEIANLIEKHL